MARIKVTGYLDTDDLDAGDVDLTHELGLSDRGFMLMEGVDEEGRDAPSIGVLSDAVFELVKE